MVGVTVIDLAPDLLSWSLGRVEARTPLKQSLPETPTEIRPP